MRLALFTTEVLRCKNKNNIPSWVIRIIIISWASLCPCISPRISQNSQAGPPWERMLHRYLLTTDHMNHDEISDEASDNLYPSARRSQGLLFCTRCSQQFFWLSCVVFIIFFSTANTPTNSAFCYISWGEQRFSSHNAWPKKPEWRYHLFSNKTSIVCIQAGKLCVIYQAGQLHQLQLLHFRGTVRYNLLLPPVCWISHERTRFILISSSASYLDLNGTIRSQQLIIIILWIYLALF